MSLSTTISKASSGSHSGVSSNSNGLKDKHGQDQVYSTIGLYQVPD